MLFDHDKGLAFKNHIKIGVYIIDLPVINYFTFFVFFDFEMFTQFFYTIITFFTLFAFDILGTSWTVFLSWRPKTGFRRAGTLSWGAKTGSRRAGTPS